MIYLCIMRRRERKARLFLFLEQIKRIENRRERVLGKECSPLSGKFWQKGMTPVC